jgi:arabinogalactan endo-1,4-beta-galactosidase
MLILVFLVGVVPAAAITGLANESPANLVRNPSFELTEGTGTAAWYQFWTRSDTTLRFMNNAGNSRTGSHGVDWWGVMNGNLSQTIYNVAPGYYSFSIWVMTTDNPTTFTLSAAGQTVQGVHTTSWGGVTGWGQANFREVRLDNILVAAPGDITINIHVGSTAATWGVIDDVSFVLMNIEDVTKQNAPPLMYTGRQFDLNDGFNPGQDVSAYIKVAVSNAGSSNIPIPTGEITYLITAGTSIIFAENEFRLNGLGSTTIRATKPGGHLFLNDAVVYATFTVVGDLPPTNLVIDPVGNIVYGDTFRLSARLYDEPVADAVFSLVEGDDIAIVDADGTVTVIEVGIFQVAATYDGNASNPINIIAGPRPITIAPSDIRVLDKPHNGTDVAIVEFNLSEASGFLAADLGGIIPSGFLQNEYLGPDGQPWILENMSDGTGRAAKLTAWGTARFDNPDVGNNKTVTITDITLGGTERHKYVLESTTAVVTGNIIENIPVPNNPIHIQRIPYLRQDFIMGVDLSTEPALRAATASPHAPLTNIVWRGRDGQPADIYETLADHGVNYIRARIWNHPYNPAHFIPNHPEFGSGFGPGGHGAGNSDVDKAIEMGLRATEQGMRLLANFHFSDFWADPARFNTPRAWLPLSPIERRQAVYDFTYESLDRMIQAGVDVGMVQIGNEKNPGMAGVSALGNLNMYHMVRYGLRAIDSINEKYGLNILRAVHFTDPHALEAQMQRAQNLYDAGAVYDVFLLSWYPYLHRSVEEFTATMTAISETFDVYVGCAEVSYAPVPGGYGNFWAYNQDVQGQANAVTDAIRAVAAVPNGRGIAVFYWEPAWPTTCAIANRWYGTGWRARYVAGYGDTYTYGGPNTDGNSTRNTSQMFSHIGDRVPLASLDVWRLVHTGAIGVEPVAPVAVGHWRLNTARASAITIEADTGLPLQMPATIEVVYTDNLRIHEPVVWNPEQLRDADLGPSAIYIVEGTVTLTHIGGGERTFDATVDKRVPNLINDPSFEEFSYPERPTWTVTGGSLNLGNLTPYPGQASNARTGSQAIHFGSGMFNRVISQQIFVPVAGYYSFSAWLQGANDNNHGSFVFNVVGENVVSGVPTAIAQRTFRGGTTWGTFLERGINGIHISAPGYVTVSFTTVNQPAAGIWGALDDAYFGMMDNDLAMILMEANVILDAGQGDHSDSLWNAFISARNIAAGVIQQWSPTTANVNNAIDGLRAAINDLLTPRGKLTTLVAQVEEMERENIPATGWTRLMSALAAANRVLANANSTDAQILAAHRNLEAILATVR